MRGSFRLAFARLEYRLYDADAGHPLLYVYNHIDKDEISMRFACDYYVKDGTVYEKLSCSLERGQFVVYVRTALEENAAVPGNAEALALGGGIRVELREYREDTDHYPVHHTFCYPDDDDALLLLQAGGIERNGTMWLKSSTEVDEDRGVYVYYAVKASEGT
jgi:hypothetical protein